MKMSQAEALRLFKPLAVAAGISFVVALSAREPAINILGALTFVGTGLPAARLGAYAFGPRPE